MRCPKRLPLILSVLALPLILLSGVDAKKINAKGIAAFEPEMWQLHAHGHHHLNNNPSSHHHHISKKSKKAKKAHKKNKRAADASIVGIAGAEPEVWQLRAHGHNHQFKKQTQRKVGKQVKSHRQKKQAQAMAKKHLQARDLKQQQRVLAALDGGEKIIVIDIGHHGKHTSGGKKKHHKNREDDEHNKYDVDPADELVDDYKHAHGGKLATGEDDETDKKGDDEADIKEDDWMDIKEDDWADIKEDDWADKEGSEGKGKEDSEGKGKEDNEGKGMEDNEGKDGKGDKNEGRGGKEGKEGDKGSTNDGKAPKDGKVPADEAAPADGRAPNGKGPDGKAPADGKTPADGKSPAYGKEPDGKSPADGRTPADRKTPAYGKEPDGKPPADGKTPADRKTPANGKTPADGKTPVDEKTPVNGKTPVDVKPPVPIVVAPPAAAKPPSPIIPVQHMGEFLTKCNTAGQVALTFSEGPSEATTQMLEILKEAKARVTFFANATWLEYMQYAGVTRRAYADGHLIGMTYRIPNDSSKGMTEAELRADIAKQASRIHNLIGQFPKYVRLHDAGLKDPLLEPVMRSMGYTLVGFSIDEADYKFNTRETASQIAQIYETTFAKQSYAFGRKGSYVVVGYDIPASGAAAALPAIISTVIKNEYDMVRLDGCVNDKTPYKKSPMANDGFVGDEFSFGAAKYVHGQSHVAVQNGKPVAGRMPSKTGGSSPNEAERLVVRASVIVGAVVGLVALML